MTQLADVSPLLALPEQAWRAFAAHLLQLGITPRRVEPVVTAVQDLHPVLRRPARAHHLRRIQEPLGYAMRMFLFGDPVTEEEASAALGDRLASLIEVGFLRRVEGGGVVSPFVIGLLDDLFVVSDDLSLGGDAVMGFGDTTMELCRAAFPRERKRRALDLGCGSGTLALALSDGASRVVATDINPRAVLLARLNTMLNGLRNVDVREGDLFSPVAGEQFDLIAAQPPFVSRPQGTGTATFLDGGQRGDELALSLLSNLVTHLAPGGRAVLRVDWPDHGDAPLEERLRAALGDEGDLLVLRAPRVGLDDHATSYAAGLHPALDAAYEREVLARLDHLERAGIRAIVPTLTIVERTAHGSGRTSTLDVRPFRSIGVTSERIDKLLLAREIARDPARLLSSTLRVPEGTVFAEEQRGPGAHVESTLSARFDDAALVHPVQMTPTLLFAVTAVHEAPDVRTGLRRLAEQHESSEEEVVEHVLPAIERALVAGLLEPAE